MLFTEEWGSRVEISANIKDYEPNVRIGYLLKKFLASANWQAE